MSAKGGVSTGASHHEGGIPLVVKSTGQQVELEGGEGVINKRNMASEKTYEFQGKQLTTCEIASEINKANGNGVSIDCDDIIGKKYKYDKGGNVGRKSSVTFEDYQSTNRIIDGENPASAVSEFRQGGTTKDISVPKANKMFHLPLELAVYVPSTQDVDKVISESELEQRVSEVSKYLASTFGGFTKSDKIGGYLSSKSEVVTEDVVPVTSFATREDFESNKDALINKMSDWAKEWGQEAIGFEFEGDMYYVPQNFKRGGAMYSGGGGVDKKDELNSKEQNAIKSMVLNGFYGASGSLTKKQRLEVLQSLIAKGYLDENGDYTSKAVEYVRPKYTNGGGITQEQFDERVKRAVKNVKYDGDKILIEGKQIGTYTKGNDRRKRYSFYYATSELGGETTYAHAHTRKYAVQFLIEDLIERGLLYNDEQENDDTMYDNGGEVDGYKLNRSDAVMYKGKTWYVSEKNGQLGIVNYEQGAWGSDYPFVPIEKIDMTKISDMNENKVRFDGGGDVNFSEFDWESAYKPLTPEEEQDLRLQLMSEQSRDKQIANDKLAHSLGYDKTMTWNEIVISLVKDTKKMMQEFKRISNKQNVEEDNSHKELLYTYILANITDLKKLGGGAKKYADNLLMMLDENRFGGGGQLKPEYVESLIPYQSFNVDFYLSSDTRNPELEGEEIEAKSVAQAIEYSKAIAQRNGLNYFEIYQGDLYLGNVNFAKSQDFIEGRGYKDYTGKKFDKGGDVALNEGTKHELEHSSTINKFKKKGMSTKSVAMEIAKDHLKKDKDYYKKLDMVEHSTLAEIISTHEKNEIKDKNRKRFDMGGNTMFVPHLVHIVLDQPFKTEIFTMEGKHDGDTMLKKNVMYKMQFLNNRGTETALQFPDSLNYIILPNNVFAIKGYDTKFAGGGNVPLPYESYKSDLSDNDIKILNLLRSNRMELNGANHFTIEQKQLLSSFRGTNLANQLSTQIITKMFSLLFKYHSETTPIKRIHIKNVGTGNMLNLAPTYIDEIVVSDEYNMFMEVESQICGITNEATYLETWMNYDEFTQSPADAIVYTYPTINPMVDVLSQGLSEMKNNCVALCLAEFTSENHLNNFVADTKANGMVLSTTYIFDKINEGVSSKGKYTLIYFIRKSK